MARLLLPFPRSDVAAGEADPCHGIVVGPLSLIFLKANVDPADLLPWVTPKESKRKINSIGTTNFNGIF